MNSSYKLNIKGFSHEHMRPDRDEYVKILWENIDEKDWKNFGRDEDGNDVLCDCDEQTTDYDYYSILHYGSGQCSKNRHPTIVIKDTGKWIPGHRTKLRPSDIQDINNVYGMPEEGD